MTHPIFTIPEENGEVSRVVPTLDEFAREAARSHGVALQPLTIGTLLTVRTENSRYQMTVLDGDERSVLIKGGRTFPVETEVRVAGATLGGCAVKLGWIVEGLRLELTTDRGPIITSRVHEITVEGENDDLDLDAA